MKRIPGRLLIRVAVILGLGLLSISQSAWAQSGFGSLPRIAKTLT